MPRKPRRKSRKWVFPATNLLNYFEQGTWANDIAEQLGVQRSTVQRWRWEPTTFDPYTADLYATRLGQHPSRIWPNWFDLPEYTPTERQQILNSD